MELRKHLSFKVIAAMVYFACFAVYIIIGLQPVEATRSYAITGQLSIPDIGLVSDVTAVELDNGNLPTPDDIVGSYTRATNKTFLYGHSSTVFKNLNHINLNSKIIYNNKTYTVYRIEYLPKDEIKMNKILKSETKDTIVIMTCAGKDEGNNKFSHRFIIYAA